MEVLVQSVKEIEQVQIVTVHLENMMMEQVNNAKVVSIIVPNVLGLESTIVQIVMEAIEKILLLIALV